MKKDFIKAVENENEEDLINCLHFERSKEINSIHFDSIEKALRGTWHSQHEDLVNTIYLQGLKDDIFIEPIIDIALKKDVFRLFDDESEATLRKCVHALKTIDSDKSASALTRLENLNNYNVQTVLEIYKK
jgi:hypothetical protein